MPVDGLDRSRLHFVQVDGVRTRYYVDGSGPPVVLFSGGTFGTYYSLDAWSLNLPALARRCEVYAVDRIGQGHTEPPDRVEDCVFDRAYQHAREFLSTVVGRPATLVGHSRGGLLVTWLALEHPEMVGKLVIVDSDSVAPELPGFPVRAFYETLPGLDGPPSAETARLEPDSQAIWKEQVTDDWVERMVEIGRQPKFGECRDLMFRKGGLSLEIASADRRRSDALRRIDEEGLSMPALVIWGLDDRSAPHPKGMRLYERIAMKTPVAELHVLNGAGHYSFRDRYEAFNRVVTEFVLDESNGGDGESVRAEARGTT